MNSKEAERTVNPQPIADWCREANVGRTTLYNLPPELKPRMIRLGRLVRVIESPAAWARRVAEKSA